MQSSPPASDSVWLQFLLTLPLQPVENDTHRHLTCLNFSSVHLLLPDAISLFVHLFTACIQLAGKAHDNRTFPHLIPLLDCGGGPPGMAGLAEVPLG